MTRSVFMHRRGIAGVPTLLTSDSFDRADSNTTMGSTDGAGSSDPKTWVPRASTTWGIISNRAYCVTSITSGSCTVNIGIADIDMLVTMATFSAGTGLIFRRSGISDFWHLARSGSALVLTKFQGGVSTTIFSTGTAANGDRLRVRALGNDISCFKNGVLLGATSDSFNASVGVHGLFASSVTTSRWDDFVIYAPQ